MSSLAIVFFTSLLFVLLVVAIAISVALVALSAYGAVVAIGKLISGTKVYLSELNNPYKNGL